MASLDVKRPAAQEQLAVLGEQVGVDTLPIVAGQNAGRRSRAAPRRRRGSAAMTSCILDTAGRTHIDEPLMAEMAEIKAASSPHEILLVADSLTGQDAVNLAKSFDERVGITGLVLTRIDGDGRGGAALSMRAVTGKPIKLIGTGEKMDALEDFDPQRIANRILGMGDIVSLVEKAAQTIDAEKAQQIAERMRKGKFDLEDLAEQLAQMEKIGGLGGIMGMLPGIAKMKDQINSANLDDRMIKRQRAIISSMTREERRNPDVLKASRKKRIAAGSGTRVEDVNRLLKLHRQMADMMKAMGGRSAAPWARWRRCSGSAAGAWAAIWGDCRSRRRKRSRRCRSRWAASFQACRRCRADYRLRPRPARSTCRKCRRACRVFPVLAAASCRGSAGSIRSGRRNERVASSE